MPGGRLCIVIALSAMVAAIGPASGATEVAGSGLARCAQGSVAAVIGGKRVCLRAGQRCVKRLDRQYHRYGFHCHSGRLTGGPKPPKPPPPAGKIVARIPAPSVGGVAVGGGAVWVANLGPHTVTRIDPGTNAVTATIPIGDPSDNPGFGPTAVAFGHGAVWVLDGASSSVRRIDPETNRIVATIPLGVPTQASIAPLGIVSTADAVWVANHWGSEEALDGSVVRIDPQTNRVVATLGLGTSPEALGPTFITAGAGAVWVGVPSMTSVVRIDPATNSVVATTPGLECAEGQLAADATSVWIADCTAARRLDPGSNALTRTITAAGATGSGVRGIGIGYGSVWIQAGPLIRVDPASGAVTGVLDLPPAYHICGYSVAFGFDSVWVRGVDEIYRIQP